MYTGTLSYFAQLQAQYELSAFVTKGIFGYEPKIDTVLQKLVRMFASVINFFISELSLRILKKNDHGY